MTAAADRRGEPIFEDPEAADTPDLDPKERPLTAGRALRLQHPPGPNPTTERGT